MDISETILTIEARQCEIAAYVHTMFLACEDEAEMKLLAEIIDKLYQHADDLKRLRAELP